MTEISSYAMVSGVPEPFNVTQNWDDRNPLGEVDTFWEFWRGDGCTSMSRGKFDCYGLAEKIGMAPVHISGNLLEFKLTPTSVQRMIRRTQLQMDWDGRLLKIGAVNADDLLQARLTPLSLIVRPVLGYCERAWLNKARIETFSNSATATVSGVLDYGGAATVLCHKDSFVSFHGLKKWHRVVVDANLTRHQQETIMALEPEWSGTAQELLQAALKL